MPNSEVQTGSTSELYTGLIEDICIRPAADLSEYEQAFRLVYLNYLRRHYITENPSGMRMTPFNAFPDAITFVGVVHGNMVATVSLLADTPAGLPMDDIYHAETQALRDEGRRLAEVTMLADRRLSVTRSFFMLIRLMKQVFDYATLVLHADDLCITVNPHHDKFYEEYLLFSQLGGVRAYPSVSNNPAIARRLDLTRIQEACVGRPNLIRHFFKERTPMEQFENRYRLTDQDVETLFLDRSDVLRNGSEKVITMLSEYYPSVNWDKCHTPLRFA